MADSLTASERKQLAENAITYANEVLRGLDLPTREDLAAMSLEDMLALLESYGVRLDVERMYEEARAAVGRDAAQLARGTMAPARREALEKAVAREVERQAVSAANQTMGDLRQRAIDESDDRPEDERWLMWVTVNGDNACVDCKDRHGVIFLADAWEGDAPRDGNTVCGGNCKCSLVPCGPPRSEGERAAVSPGMGAPRR